MFHVEQCIQYITKGSQILYNVPIELSLYTVYNIYSELRKTSFEN